MELSVQKRNVTNQENRTLRAKGFIPAELYGKGLQNLHLAIPLKDFRKVFKAAGESTMISIVIEGERPAEGEARPKGRPVMISDVATDPVTDEILNVDLYQVRLDEKIKIKVPLEFIGESAAVKSKGGVLIKAMQEIEVEGLPGDIPRSIAVDISRLADVGNSIYVKDLGVSKSVKILVGADGVVATATAKMTEEEEAKLAAEVKPEDIKVESEEKKAERDAAKAAAAPTGEAGAKPAEGAAKPGAKPAPEKK